MAEYGYIHDTYHISFTPEYPYWWSSKAFDESHTKVPAEFEPMLRAMYDEYVLRVGTNKAVPYALETVGDSVILHRVGLSWSKQKTEEFWGWSDGCEHRWSETVERGYGEFQYCQRCSKRKCAHDKDYVIKNYGLDYWFCQTCGLDFTEEQLQQAWNSLTKQEQN